MSKDIIEKHFNDLVSAIAMQVEELFEALKSGFSDFIISLDSNPTHAKVVYDWAEKKLFTNIPHNRI